MVTTEQSFPTFAGFHPDKRSVQGAAAFDVGAPEAGSPAAADDDDDPLAEAVGHGVPDAEVRGVPMTPQRVEEMLRWRREHGLDGAAQPP
eukprot:gene6613-15426_t